MANSSYTILSNKLIDNQGHVHFLRIRPNNFQLTLYEIFQSLINKSWINNFNPNLQKSLEARVMPTIQKITNELQGGQATAVDENSGELIVSELSRKTIVKEYHYLDIPLAELFKTQVSQNPGFDFYSVNLNNVILFGEAKYVKRSTASKKALDQIHDFVTVSHKDDKDIFDIQSFVPEVSLTNYYNNQKGFIAAFSSKGESDDVVLGRIKGYASYNALKSYSELICVAVDI